jgi:uncharacterized protein involved in response to NO
LGHTDRVLVADRATICAYLLVFCGALLRCAAPLSGDAAAGLVGFGGLAWSAGFLVFVVRYLPILVGPRPDRRPG